MEYLEKNISNRISRNYISVHHHLPQVPLSHAAGEGVQQVLPDTQPLEAEAGGVLPACLVLHQRHRHEHGPQGLPRLSPGRHLRPPQ